jgi:hypothetical protein
MNTFRPDVAGTQAANILILAEQSTALNADHSTDQPLERPGMDLVTPGDVGEAFTTLS